jgi:hypothetical protein
VQQFKKIWFWPRKEKSEYHGSIPQQRQVLQHIHKSTRLKSPGLINTFTMLAASVIITSTTNLQMPLTRKAVLTMCKEVRISINNREAGQ